MAADSNVGPGAQMMLLANGSAGSGLPKLREPPLSDAGAAFGPLAVAGLSHHLNLHPRSQR